MLENLKGLMDKMYGKKILFFLPLIILIILLLLGLGVATLNTARTKSYGTLGISAGSVRNLAMPEFMAYDSVGSANSYKTASVAPSTGSVSNPKVDKKIIKNGAVDMLVKKVEDTSADIQAIANKYNGQIDNLNISNRTSDTKYGTITVRVPNDKFDLAIEDIKKLAVKVNSEVVSSDDVTAQYVDMEARLKSKRAVESQYVALLQKANKVEEIVQVHSYLDRVREEIEILQAQMNYLTRQVDMSSITVSMTSETEVQIFGITWRPITVIKQSFRNLLTDMTGIIDWLIAFIFALPGIIIRIAIFIGVLWLIVVVLTKLYKKFSKKNLLTQPTN
jgi:hypothetical protein